MSMFCFQCQETAKGKGCTVRGVCGKTEEVARLQDLLIYTLKGIAEIVVKGQLDIGKLGELNYEVLNSLFMTITNANFDDGAIEKQILKMLAFRDKLRESAAAGDLHDAARPIGSRIVLEAAASAFWLPPTRYTRPAGDDYVWLKACGLYRARQ